MADPSIPPGWDENLTAWPKRIGISALLLADLCVAGYLTLHHVGVFEGVWDPLSQSPQVLRLLGVPDAGLGVVAYGGMPWALGYETASTANSLAAGLLLILLTFPGSKTKAFASGWQALLDGQR